jgi:hypothetical protein
LISHPRLNRFSTTKLIFFCHITKLLFMTCILSVHICLRILYWINCQIPPWNLKFRQIPPWNLEIGKYPPKILKSQSNCLLAWTLTGSVRGQFDWLFKISGGYLPISKFHVGIWRIFKFQRGIWQFIHSLFVGIKPPLLSTQKKTTTIVN